MESTHLDFPAKGVSSLVDYNNSRDVKDKEYNPQFQLKDTDVANKLVEMGVWRRSRGSNEICHRVIRKVKDCCSSYLR